jgi:hypothetical protein
MSLLTLPTFSLDTSTPQFSTPSIKMRPFLIQGATTGIPPANPERINTVYTKNNNTPFYSTTASEYTSTQINTKNIILNDYCQGTTLVDMVDEASPRYEFAFAAFHANDLATTSDKHAIQHVVSLVFRNKAAIYHIQIPLVISSTLQPSDVNPLLRCWLDPSVVSKESFSMNQLFLFKQAVTVEFDRFVYNQLYNLSSTPSVEKITNIAKIVGKYTLCIVKTPQFVLNYPSLAKNDLATFSDVFNYVMAEPMHIANPRYPLQRSEDIYMLANSSSKYPSPTFYSIPVRDLTQLKLVETEGFTDSCTADGTRGRTLQDVKCYPIDLVTQVDANGGITVDENTAKPIDVRPNLQHMAAGPAPAQPPSQFNYTGLIIIILLFIVAFLIIGVSIYFVFRSSTVPPAVAAIAPTAALGSIAALGATAGPPPVTATGPTGPLNPFQKLAVGSQALASAQSAQQTAATALTAALPVVQTPLDILRAQQAEHNRAFKAARAARQAEAQARKAERALAAQLKTAADKTALLTKRLGGSP